jgi:hypothetical protein
MLFSPIYSDYKGFQKKLCMNINFAFKFYKLPPLVKIAVCQFEDDASMWATVEGEAVLSGEILDGTIMERSDSICVKCE